ncbi:MAG: SRPBCC domain-containing protein [Candidatus Methylomirabilaceae bacterium]
MTQTPYELAVERCIDAPPTTVFKAWTERLEDWWAPKPWTTRIIEQDLQPSGRSAMVMSGPQAKVRRSRA